MTARAELLQLLRTSTASLPDVIEKKMFGCEAFFTMGTIFALVWKTGRIALKLPALDRYQALASQKGAEPWTAGTKVMSGWILVPPKLEEPRALAPWLKEAHAFAGVAIAPPRAKKKVAATPATRSTSPKSSSKNMASKRAAKSASSKGA